ncbi:MAG TPA: two-component sensor histidine kinase [Flavobacteriaceae bacterium]|nr:two-component sensor histidine kinase [Flavobacteriaceae bacterium]HAT64349.1 two-component sensor histidine kinase [Flavobacteriaceae bacterium]
MTKTNFLLVLLFFVNSFLFSQTQKEIDSINNLYTQGLNIPQDSIISLFQKNLSDARKISYEDGIAGALSKLSLVFGYQGKYDESTKYGLESITMFEKLQRWDKVSYHYAEMGYGMKYRDMPKALYYMQMGKNLAEENNLENSLKDIYNNYGVLKEINNELDSALYYFNKGLELKRKLKDSVGIPYSISNIAGVYGLQKKYNKSREYFTMALEDRLRRADSIGIAENYTQIGEVYMAEEDWKNAKPFVHKSLPISIKKQYRNLTQYNYKLLSDIYKTQKNTDSALYYFEQYVAVKDSIHNIKVNENIAALSIEFETEKKENEILQQRAQLAEKDLEVRRKNTWIFGGFGLAIILGLLGYLVYNQQKLKNRQLQKEGELKEALARIETQNKLQEQRLRISRDLHDNIGSQLTFIISSIDNIKFGFPDVKEKLANKLSEISAFTTQTIYELRDTIWAMNKNEISFEDLQTRITNFINQAKVAATGIQFDFQIDPFIDSQHSFTSIRGMNIYRIIQEGVNNAIKYAKASKVVVQINETPESFTITIQDNGVGFNKEEVVMGNGLQNMSKRGRDLQGELKINSEDGKGTIILLEVPKN